jgi:hypothetical protein
VREDDHDFVGFFVQMWAKAVIRQVDRVRKEREKDEADSGSHDHNEEWSPTDDELHRNFRSRWTEEHMPVWAAYQLERWTRRLAIDRGEQVPEPDGVLAALRNALEHLDEADFIEGEAVPGPLGINRSLRTFLQ